MVIWQKKCTEKMKTKLQPVENVLAIIKHQAVVKQKRNASTIWEREIIQTLIMQLIALPIT